MAAEANAGDGTDRGCARHTIGAISRDRLYAEEPAERLDAARSLRGARKRKLLAAVGAAHPSYSPGAANAWLLLVTGKAPSWSHPLLHWREEAPVLGEPHPGFFYPDPLGFWDEVRRWIGLLVRSDRCAWGIPEALSVSALVHTADLSSGGLATLRGLVRPRVVLFLDQVAWKQSALVLAGRPDRHHIVDPHRRGQVYEGFWGHLADGTVVGKAPQHPTTRHLYRAEEMSGYLLAAPSPRSFLPSPPFSGSSAS